MRHDPCVHSTRVDSLEDYTFNLVLAQEDSAGGQGRDNQTIKGVRIPGLLDFFDLFIKVRHVDSPASDECLPCAVNVADQSHILIP